MFFNQMDTNGNGFIDYEEFTKGLHIAHPEIVDVYMLLLSVSAILPLHPKSILKPV